MSTALPSRQRRQPCPRRHGGRPWRARRRWVAAGVVVVVVAAGVVAAVVTGRFGCPATRFGG